jgi:hypothetical protein
MAHFYVQSGGQASGVVSRIGSKRSGAWTNIRGWDSGVEVHARETQGEDMFDVYMTGGSNAQFVKTLVGTISIDEKGGLIFR